MQIQYAEACDYQVKIIIDYSIFLAKHYKWVSQTQMPYTG